MLFIGGGCVNYYVFKHRVKFANTTDTTKSVAAVIAQQL